MICYGTINRGYDLLMEVRQVEEALRNPHYYVYVVENVGQGDPAEFTLRVLGGTQLQRLLSRAKEYRGYSVPWPVADYDSCQLGLSALPNVPDSRIHDGPTGNID